MLVAYATSGYSTMVVHLVANQGTGVRFPLPAQMKIKLGKYQHYKGHLYRVTGIAKHSETLEEMVIYEALYDNPDGKFWVRPAKMFAEKIAINGKKILRFKFLEK